MTALSTVSIEGTLYLLEWNKDSGHLGLTEACTTAEDEDGECSCGGHRTYDFQEDLQ